MQDSGQLTPPREIKSYVLRQGRLTAAQERALSEHAQWLIPYQNQQLDFSVCFGRVAPTVVEIGFGMGVATAQIAAANPDINYLGIEVHSPGVGNLLNLIVQQGLSNLRIIRHDAVAVLRDMVPLNALHGIHIFFPDPWPKKRHHKRRLLQADFLVRLTKHLAPQGYIHFATDWEDYAQWGRELLLNTPDLENTVSPADAYAPRPTYRPLTKFEQRGLRLGHGVWDLVFRRVSSER